MDDEEDDLTLVYMWAFKKGEESAKSRIEELEAALRNINNRLNDNDSWLAQSIDCRNIAATALGEKR